MDDMGCFRRKRSFLTTIFVLVKDPIRKKELAFDSSSIDTSNIINYINSSNNIINEIFVCTISPVEGQGSR